MNLSLLQYFVFALFLVAGHSRAALINIGINNAGGAQTIKSSLGSSLSAGSIVRIGSFSLSGAALQTAINNATTFAEINLLFTAIGETASADDGTTGPITITGAGVVGGTISNVNNTTYLPAATKLYVMVLNVAPANMATASEWLIMADSGWSIPASGTGVIAFSTINSQAEILAGTFVSSAQFNLAPIGVPEPGVVSLCLAAVGLMAARRRK